MVGTGGSDLAHGYLGPGHLPVTSVPYHGLVPDDRHPLLHAIGALGNGSEVVLPNGFLGSAEGAVGTAGELQIPTGKGEELRVNRGDGWGHWGIRI